VVFAHCFQSFSKNLSCKLSSSDDLAPVKQKESLCIGLTVEISTLVCVLVWKTCGNKVSIYKRKLYV